MKRAIFIFCVMIVIGYGVGSVFAASSRCTVVKIEGTRMVIECEKKTKGFFEGSKIKIKLDKIKTVEGC